MEAENTFTFLTLRPTYDSARLDPAIQERDSWP